MKFLVTGFKPFQGESKNPSQELLNLLELPRGSKTLLLPVVYDEVFPLLKDDICSNEYDFILMLGQAGGRKNIDLEMIAVNLRDQDSADESGKKYLQSRIDEKSEDAIISELPLRQWQSQIRDLGLGVGISHSAGAFVCNSIYFQVANLLKQSPHIKSRCLFVHVPYSDEQILGKEASMPSMPLLEMTKVVNSLIKIICDS